MIAATQVKEMSMGNLRYVECCLSWNELMGLFSYVDRLYGGKAVLSIDERDPSLVKIPDPIVSDFVPSGFGPESIRAE